jgi:transcriptional regulator with XRE-family HTH domain
MGRAAAREEIFAKRIGQALATARNAASMTQEEVSEKLGVNTETISRFERGHTLPPLGRLFELASLYGVLPETLVAGGAGRSLDPGLDVSFLINELPEDDREFVRNWVAAMCVHLSRAKKERR